MPQCNIDTLVVMMGLFLRSTVMENQVVFICELENLVKGVMPAFSNVLKVATLSFLFPAAPLEVAFFENISVQDRMS